MLEYVQDVAGAFLDNIRVEGPRTDYSGEEVAPSIRRYIQEYICNIDRVLSKVERSSAIISAVKT